MNEILCRYAPLPGTINAVTVVDANGDFNVYINANLSLTEQTRAWEHECTHIRQNHFYRKKAVKECEAEARQAKPLPDASR
ncbi:MAG: hypothetical protein MSA49_02015 [Clostridia bacterium]|nr:hypothetical protein [Clostridia bacterium]